MIFNYLTDFLTIFEDKITIQVYSEYNSYDSSTEFVTKINHAKFSKFITDINKSNKEAQKEINKSFYENKITLEMLENVIFDIERIQENSVEFNYEGISRRIFNNVEILYDPEFHKHYTEKPEFKKIKIEKLEINEPLKKILGLLSHLYNQIQILKEKTEYMHEILLDRISEEEARKLNIPVKLMLLQIIHNIHKDSPISNTKLESLLSFILDCNKTTLHNYLSNLNKPINEISDKKKRVLTEDNIILVERIFRKTGMKKEVANIIEEYLKKL